jgi:hypothetical protein
MGGGVGHEARVGVIRNDKFWLENLNGGDNLEDLGVDVGMLLQWMLKR